MYSTFGLTFKAYCHGLIDCNIYYFLELFLLDNFHALTFTKIKAWSLDVHLHIYH